MYVCCWLNTIIHKYPAVRLSNDNVLKYFIRQYSNTQMLLKSDFFSNSVSMSAWRGSGRKNLFKWDRSTLSRGSTSIFQASQTDILQLGWHTQWQITGSRHCRFETESNCSEIISLFNDTHVMKWPPSSRYSSVSSRPPVWGGLGPAWPSSCVRSGTYTSTDMLLTMDHNRNQAGIRTHHQRVLAYMNIAHHQCLLTSYYTDPMYHLRLNRVLFCHSNSTVGI